MPEDTGERVKEWAEGEGAKVGKRDELVPAMESRGHDSGAVKVMLGG